MRSGLRSIVLSLVAAFLLVASPAALGDGSQAMIVSLGGVWPNLTLNYETLDGAITHSVAAPANVDPSNFVPAANGSIVFNDGNDPSGSGGIWLIRADGSATRIDPSSTDYDPSLSYDGSKVAFVRYDAATGSSDIYVMNSDGSGQRLVASGEGTNALNLPVFSPDGGSIAYWCGPASPTDPTGRGCGPLTDGSYRESGVMRVGVDGSSPRMIVIGAGSALEPGGPGSLSWSPDGQWILLDGLLSTAPGNGSTEHQLFAYRTDGSDLFNNLDPTRQVTHETDPYGPGEGQFCGSSTLVYFLKVVDDSGTEGNFSYTINFDGTSRRQIFLSTADYGKPWGVCVLPATGAAPSPLVDMTHITVPSVRALGVKAATRRLLAANLSVGKMARTYSARIRKNHVVSQYPRAGAVAHRTRKKGPPVKLVVSRGPRR